MNIRPKRPVSKNVHRLRLGQSEIKVKLKTNAIKESEKVCLRVKKVI